MEYSLVLPTPAMEPVHRQYLASWEATGEKLVPWASGLQGMRYSEWLHASAQKRTHPPAGQVPSTLFAFVNSADALLGFLDLRHSLDNLLYLVGGHIGYGLHPHVRGARLAPIMLALGLEKAAQAGLGRVLVTCHKANLASARTIRHCKGVLENEVADDRGQTVQRYWIALEQTEKF